jgi:hypothetical protein
MVEIAASFIPIISGLIPRKDGLVIVMLEFVKNE